MSLTPTQAIVTVKISGHSLAIASQHLERALIPYRDARIVSLVEKSDWFGSFFGATSLIAVIDYTPDTPSEVTPD